MFGEKKKNGKKEKDFEEIPRKVELENPEMIYVSSGDAMANQRINDLMFLIGKAIEKWAEMYDMTDLPKDIILEQALAIMNSIYKKNKNKNDNY